MTNTYFNESSGGEDRLPSRKSTIYIVDDDFDVRKSLRFLLETEGFDVRTFHSGSALLGSQVRHKADCLVIDYKMSGINGLELLRQLRLFDILTPIVLMTGYFDDNLSEKAFSAGVSHVLKKPHLAENLTAVLREAIGQSDRHCYIPPST